MSVPVFVFLLVVCLLLSLALLWRLDWLHFRPSFSRGGAKRTRLHRLLKPRCPDDCPACRLASTASLGGGPAPAPVRPWREIKSRRGARHPGQHRRLRLSQSAVPLLWHHRCSDPRAGRRWQAWAYRADPDLPLSGLPHHFHCPSSHAIVSSENPFPSGRHGADLALAEGLDPSAAERIFGYRQATISMWLSRAGSHAEILHKRCFRTLQLPHVQLDELRTRLRSCTQVLWLWLAIDPCTKILPVLQLGPRTQNMAHMLIHSLRQLLVPGCIPIFTSDGLNLYFYALTAHFGQWSQVCRRGSTVLRWQVATGLIYGQVKKCYQRRKLVRVTHVMRLGHKQLSRMLCSG